MKGHLNLSAFMHQLIIIVFLPYQDQYSYQDFVH